MPSKIRVFIGTEPKTEIARRVLQHSIEVHTDAEVEFVPLLGSHWSYPMDGIKCGTGFSLRRWMIPAYCGWEGRAIYLDADQLVFGDIEDIWKIPERFPRVGRTIWCTWQRDTIYPDTSAPQTSVMVIDCAAAANEPCFDLLFVLEHLKDQGAKVYQRFMHALDLRIEAGILPDEWNHLCKYKSGVTKLLHYTSVPNQPWYKPDDVLALQWKMAFQRALNAGIVLPQDAKAAIAAFGKDARGEPCGLHPEYAGYVDGNRCRIKQKEKASGH